MRNNISSGGDRIDNTLLEDIIVTVLDLTDETGRLLSPPFRVLSPREVIVFHLRLL